MGFVLRFRLSLMMFLNYVIWGSWYVTLGTYLTATLHFSGTETGLVFGTTAVASMVSPFFVGIVADRFLAAQKVLAIVHLLGAGVLYAVTRFDTFPAVYALMLLYCLLYFPTIALTNSLVLRNISNPGREFPLIRVLGTLGWIVIGITLSRLNVEKTATPFLLGAAASVLMAAYSLTLPNTPPEARTERMTLRGALGLDALEMLRKPSYLVFVIASILACIPLTFYFSFTNAYLNDVHVKRAAELMTLGQASEVVMMLLMPFVFRRISVKGILLAGLAAWTVRYVLLAYGNGGNAMWMFLIAILLHGICYDFFFMTGQLYTDQQAPAHLRNTAQGFITFVTYGVGMFIGSLLSGGALDVFSEGSVHHWKSFWLSSAAGALVILLVVSLFFRDRSRIETRKTEVVGV